MVNVSCLSCSKDFYTKPSWIIKGYGKYCSMLCKRKAQKTGQIVKCSICGKETYKTLKALRLSKSQKYFCGKSCQAIWRNSEFVGKKHANYITGKSSYKSILSRNKVPKICSLCNTNDSRVLAVHHVDGNHYNNEIKNLAWLCHNCHHLVHHDNVEKLRFMDIHRLRVS